ncbi:MAG: pyridoxamine 5'-phosphate oxidase family protein [Planctomycetota bacterium]|jgi:general stress protein 26
MRVNQLHDYEAISSEVWARLAHAADRPGHPMRFFVLATSGPDGVPDARLMVLRGADRRRGRVWFHTDRRSEKVRQLEAQPALCAVTYDVVDCIQIRLRGRGSVHVDDELAWAHWEQAESAVKALYAATDAPGIPLRQPDPRLMDHKRAMMDAATEAKARSNFAVIEVVLETIEWLQVRDGLQRRALLHAATGWAPQPVAP